MVRVAVDGKQFRLGDARFRFRGVTYGTFRARTDGMRYPDRDTVKLDFAAMEAAGFTVVRTYTPPAEDVVELAADSGLRLLAGVFYADWRYLVGASRRQRRRVVHEARAEVRATARRLAGNDQILALSLGNEVPADVLRWVGTGEIARVIDELADVVRNEDPDCLVTYGNYPTAEYLPLENLDFLTFNVFLERPADFRKYLTRLHHLAGDRPVVLGEVGIDAGLTPEGERGQAETLDWQLSTAVERGIAGTCVFSWTDEWCVGDVDVTDWHFGLTRHDRSPRPALAVAESWNGRSVADLDAPWPSMSVVICAYNATSTLDECLQATCALDYPDLDILVVDDGSTDDTADIARRYPRVRLLAVPHGGLSIARNAGMREARGDLVVYLDSDAYPTPEWLYYLALGLDGPTVGGVGGPNLPPRDDPIGAQEVARAPGGPVHVLIGDDRAEHVPGCNMAFWKPVLEQVGGCDPIYLAAGDDVDLCWKVLDAGWDIGFHPAALVWHHRRPGLRPYLRQQRGYGRAEALVEARHPDRFNAVGSARWRGRIYNSLVPVVGRQRIYRGVYGAAAYQSVYRGGGYGLDLLHQVGLPTAAAILPLALFGFVWPALALLALPSVVLAAALFVTDLAQARPPRSASGIRALRFRTAVACMTLLQPLARAGGRLRHRAPARRDLPPGDRLPWPVTELRRHMLLFPEDRPRADLAAAVVTLLRRNGMRVIEATGWEDYDARLIGSSLVRGDLVTSSHPVGSVQMRVRRRLCWPRLVTLVTLVTLVGVVDALPAALLGLLMIVEVGRGLWRTGGLVRRLAIAGAATGQ